MLKIKLTRLGKKKEPRYRIVVNEARDKRDGSYIAKIGIYQPTANPKVLEIDTAAYKEWLAKGAQPTDTVAFLFKRYESGNPFPEKAPKLSKKAKEKLAAAEEEKKAAAEAEKEATEKPKEAEEEKTEQVDETAAAAEAEVVADEANTEVATATDQTTEAEKPEASEAK